MTNHPLNAVAIVEYSAWLQEASASIPSVADCKPPSFLFFCPLIWYIHFSIAHLCGTYYLLRRVCARHAHIPCYNKKNIVGDLADPSIYFDEKIRSLYKTFFDPIYSSFGHVYFIRYRRAINNISVCFVSVCI